ncbi:hypothetical protein WMF31_04685 [Sorangium sp. So ce1036]|uniref:hypothetical protein n=1 Tax=Sorangium sp. So ce1036 TaxID=3133328 RepID=UPI003F08B55C
MMPARAITPTPSSEFLALGVSVRERADAISIVHHVDADGTVWASRGRIVLRRARGVGAFAPFCRFPATMPRDAAAFPRLLARAARADKCNVYRTSRGVVLGVRAGTIYRLEEGRAPVPLSTALAGDCVLHRGIIEDPLGAAYLGEYTTNERRDPVRIHRITPDGDRVEIAHEFPAGSVRHVHGLFLDPFDPGATWVTTGDRDGECYLWRTRDGFRTIERIGDGTQRWRAVQLFFTADHVCWLTDSEVTQNHACRFERRSLALEVGCEIPASAWYGAQLPGPVLLALTVVERGAGIRRDTAAILASRDGITWRELASFRKDRWRPYWLFKNGVLALPSGRLSLDDLWLSGEALVGLDGSSLRIAIDGGLP